MRNKFCFICCLLLLVACADKQGKEVTDGKDSQSTSEVTDGKGSPVTYQAEPDSPWGSFTMPIKEAEYTLQAPASQQDEILVNWIIKVINTGEDLGIDVDSIVYPEGTICSYSRTRKTFKVSARDGANYWFTVSNIDWLVKTNIQR